MVINLADKNSNGTHWVAAKIIGGKLYYADPFGTKLYGYPPRELENLHIPTISNSVAWQHPNSNLCGYFSYLFTKALNKLKPGTNQKEFEKALKESIK